jgi:hypothetical protein
MGTAKVALGKDLPARARYLDPKPEESLLDVRTSQSLIYWQP